MAQPAESRFSLPTFEPTLNRSHRIGWDVPS